MASLATSSSSGYGKLGPSKLGHRARKQSKVDDVDSPLVIAAGSRDDEVLFAPVDDDAIGCRICRLTNHVAAALPKFLGTRTPPCRSTRERPEVIT